MSSAKKIAVNVVYCFILSDVLVMQGQELRGEDIALIRTLRQPFLLKPKDHRFTSAIRMPPVNGYKNSNRPRGSDVQTEGLLRGNTAAHAGKASDHRGIVTTVLGRRQKQVNAAFLSELREASA